MPVSDMVHIKWMTGTKTLELSDDPKDWPYPPRWEDTGEIVTKDEAFRMMNMLPLDRDRKPGLLERLMSMF